LGRLGAGRGGGHREYETFLARVADRISGRLNEVLVSRTASGWKRKYGDKREGEKGRKHPSTEETPEKTQNERGGDLFFATQDGTSAARTVRMMRREGGAFGEEGGCPQTGKVNHSDERMRKSRERTQPTNVTLSRCPTLGEGGKNLKTDQVTAQ